MIEPAAPPPHRDAAFPRGRARGLVALLAVAVAAILMLAPPASARAPNVGQGCIGATVTVMSETAARTSAAVQVRGIEAAVDVTAVEFDLPRAAQATVRLRWPDPVAYAEVSGRAPASVVDGSPHRPPRAG